MNKDNLPPVPLIVTSLGVAAALLGDAMLYVVMPSRPEFWSLTIFQVGILLSANRFVRFFTNPLSSYIVNKFGVYRPFKLTLIASLGVLAMYALSTSFIVLLLARLLWGACWSVLRLVSQWIASDVSSEANVGLYLATNASLIRIGSIGGAVFGGLLSDYLGYRRTFLIFGVFTLLSWFCWLKYSRYGSSNVSTNSNEGNRNFLSLLKDREVFLLGISGLTVGIVISGLMSASLGHFIRAKFGVEFDLLMFTVTVTGLTGILLGFRSLAEVGVGPFGGYISDRYGRLKVLIFSVAITSIGLLLLGISDSPEFITVMLLLVFVGGVLLTVQLLPLVSLIAEKHSRSEVFSVYNTFQDFGSALGPFIGLSLISAAYLPYLFQVCSLLLIALVLVLIFKFKRHFQT
tara:strand:+ start:3497 stop:4705 length:1209 start_codon:yes stop_codon:yes gene_type:complete